MFWKQFYRNIIFSICLAYPFQVQSHGNGAPSNRCDSMLPGHWVTPQETISPFQISIDKTKITPGDRVNITLSTIPGHPTGFKGFFVMVKDLDNNGTNYGIFDLNSSDLNHARPVHCFEVRNSAMTHSANDAKKSVELTWIAPELEHSENGSDIKGKQLKVVATFVKDFWTIWMNVEPAQASEGEGRLILKRSEAFSLPQPISPKFQVPPGNMQHQFRGEVPVHPLVGANGATHLEENSSWDHLKSAWNYAVGLFSFSK